MRRRSPLAGLALGLFLLLPACGTSRLTATPPPEGLIDVAVSIVPQKYFVERIGGDSVNVSVMVGPGFNPATYEPKPSQIQQLSVTQMYVRIGVPFEAAWMDRIAAANEHMLIVDQSEGVERMGGTDPHIWLSPQLAKIQAQTICDGLVEIDPDNEGFYHANLGSLLSDVDELDVSIKDTLAGLESRKLMVFHPAWSYFARDYDLEMIPVQIEGSDPSPAEMAGLIRMAKESNIKVIFAQPEFSTSSAETIADEIGGEVLLISPLAPDWLDNLQRVADTFSEVLAREQ
ncbi:MAG: cation ABC transporter substrate-binding protein [Chloroflexi bacterium B3_Chlor]|nr:MAG: cation ABC transporter substrate-binding protein [Chloroflexi bacterium B3_Chlor]